MNERYDDKIHVPDMASNSTGRLAASQPGEQPQARCPKCGQTRKFFLECGSCEWEVAGNAERIAQFFGPSAPSPLPTYEQAKPHIGWGWSGFRIEDEDSLKFTFNRMRDAMQKYLGVAPSGSAGQEPHLQPPSIRCTNCGMYGFYVRHDESLGGLVLKCVDCGEQKLIEPVVSASPAQLPDYICPKCRADGYKGNCKKCGYSAHHEHLAAAQPVAANPPNNGQFCEHGVCCESCRQNLAKEVMPTETIRGHHSTSTVSATLASLKTSGLANPPKVEEIARQIHEACTWGSVGKYISPDKVAEILGPFFTPVSHPPRLRDISRIAVDFLVEPARPREDFYALLETHLTEKLAVTPVSGNGTEPPTRVTQEETKGMHINDQPHDLDWDKVWALLEPWREVWNGDKRKYAGQYPQWMADAAGELFAHDMCDAWSWNGYVSAAMVIISRHYEAGAASHNGQGWGLRETELLIKLRAADEMARVADDWVERGQISSRSALADARLNYGKPYTYEFTKPLPAPPSEADGPQEENKN